MSAKLCGVEQRAPAIFGRAAITLGIGPHSSFLCFLFRKFHSTNLALIDVIDNILEHLDARDCGVGICIDLQKAFDTVNHDILLKKLDMYGIRGVMYNWIKDYLTNRQQYVSLQDVCSSSLCVTSYIDDRI